MPPTQTRIDTYIRENSGTINITHNRVGRPPIDESKDDIIKTRVKPHKHKEILSFCAGRRITRSDYLRELMELDPDYFDYIGDLNNPEIKQFIFHALKLYKKI